MATIEQKARTKKVRNPFKAIPWYGWVGAIIFIVFQIGLYKLACFFAQQVPWPICPRIDVIDGGIPFCPYFFIEIYFLAYAFWFISPLWISTSRQKDNFINFMIFSTIASFIGFFWMILMPTYLDRVKEGLVLGNADNWTFGPVVEQIKTPLSKFLIKSIITMDTGPTGWNLCPSYHCMASAICAFGVLKRKEHHWGTQVGFGVMSILVCLATVFVKQHYFVDILGGVGVATIPYIIICLIWHPGEKIILDNPYFMDLKKKIKK